MLHQPGPLVAGGQAHSVTIRHARHTWHAVSPLMRLPPSHRLPAQSLPQLLQPRLVPAKVWQRARARGRAQDHLRLSASAHRALLPEPVVPLQALVWQVKQPAVCIDGWMAALGITGRQVTAFMYKSCR